MKPVYARNTSRYKFWCKSHNRWATHWLYREGESPVPHCAPGAGGILLPCHCEFRLEEPSPLDALASTPYSGPA